MKLKTTLYRELVSLVIIILGIIFISLGLLLPKLLLPVYEKNIYQYLKQPLMLIENDFNENEFNDVAYLYIVDGKILTSENLNEIIDVQPEQIIEKIDKDYGKINYLGHTYYYYSINNAHINKIALTNDNYLLNIRSDIMTILLPTIIVTLIISIGIIILWARKLVRKIQILKENVDNIANDDYINKFDGKVDDELYSLSVAINNMKDNLKKENEYKNQMYQNISHDFKTPLTVIKSYIEAMEDKVMDEESCIEIIKEQVNKLEMKVHSLLYLNKLAYIKEIEYSNHEVTDIESLLKKSVDKFKIQRKDVEFNLIIKGNTIFKGTYDMWEAIIDNLLNNFLRYANKEIKIKVTNNRISLYNDGPNIDETVFDSLFNPYKKGLNGQFGLGLSIVKKTLNLLGYEINVTNEKKGVNFIIK